MATSIVCGVLTAPCRYTFDHTLCLSILPTSRSSVALAGRCVLVLVASTPLLDASPNRQRHVRRLDPRVVSILETVHPHDPNSSGRPFGYSSRLKSREKNTDAPPE